MRGGRCRGWAIAAGAAAAVLGAGCGGGAREEASPTATSATAPAAQAPGKPKHSAVPEVQTGGAGPTAATRARDGSGAPRGQARGRSLAGTADDQNRALTVLFDERDLPAGWSAEGRPTNGLTAIDRRRGTRPVDLRCFAGDRARTVAALARTARLADADRSDRLDGDVIVYADAQDARGALAYVRGSRFRTCLGSRLRSELTAERGVRAVGETRNSIADLPAADGGGTAAGDGDGVTLRYTLDVEQDGRRGTVAADVVVLRAGPTLASFQLSRADAAAEVALRDELAAELARRLEAAYG